MGETHNQIALHRRADGILLLLTVAWGSMYPVTKLLLEGGLHPTNLVLLRFGFATVIFALLFAWRTPGLFEGRTIAGGLVLGAILYAALGLQTTGLMTTMSSRAGFITTLYVVIAPLLTFALLRRAPAPSVLLGVVLAILGLWALTAPGTTFSSMLEPWSAGGFDRGELLVLGSAVAFAVYIIALDRIGAGGVSIAGLTLVQFFAVSVLSLGHMMATDIPIALPANSTAWGLILYLAVVPTVVTTYYQVRYQPQTTPTRAAVIYTMESVFGLVFSAIALGERLSMLALGGAAVIVVALLVTVLGQRSDEIQ